MNALEKALLRVYLDDELDAEGAHEFEILLLQREDLAEVVEADTALRIGMIEPSHSGFEVGDSPNTDRKEIPRSISEKPDSIAEMTAHRNSPGAKRRHGEPHAPLPRRGRRARAFSFAAAAVLLMGLGFGMGTFTLRNSAALEFGKPVQIEKVRGIAKIQMITLPDHGYLVAYTDVSLTEHCQSLPRVTFSQAGKILFDRPVERDDLGFAWLVLPRSKLKAGHAGVDIFCGDMSIAAYPVELVE